MEGIELLLTMKNRVAVAQVSCVPSGAQAGEIIQEIKYLGACDEVFYFAKTAQNN